MTAVSHAVKANAHSFEIIIYPAAHHVIILSGNYIAMVSQCIDSAYYRIAG